MINNSFEIQVDKDCLIFKDVSEKSERIKTYPPTSKLGRLYKFFGFGVQIKQGQTTLIASKKGLVRAYKLNVPGTKTKEIKSLFKSVMSKVQNPTIPNIFDQMRNDQITRSNQKADQSTRPVR